MSLDAVADQAELTHPLGQVTGELRPLPEPADDRQHLVVDEGPCLQQQRELVGVNSSWRPKWSVYSAHPTT